MEAPSLAADVQARRGAPIQPAAPPQRPAPTALQAAAAQIGSMLAPSASALQPVAAPTGAAAPEKAQSRRCALVAAPSRSPHCLNRLN